MQVGQCISKDDLKKLTLHEYLLFRETLRAMGHRVNDSYGRLSKIDNEDCSYLTLDYEGDLLWTCRLEPSHQYHYNEIMSLIAMGMLL